MTRSSLLTLRAELVRMREAGEPFDYRTTKAECGCVVPVSARLFGSIEGWVDIGSLSRIGVDHHEEGYILGYVKQDLDPAPHKVFHQMSKSEATGRRGLTEAIRRVDVVLARYPEEKNNDERK